MDTLVAEGSRLGAEAQASAPGVCAVGKLRLSQFRNYETLDIETSSAPVVLVGPNGAGKTNILEAISFLAPGKGLRAAAVNEPQKMGSGQCWAVFAQIGDLEIGTGMDPESAMARRTIRVNGVALKSQHHLAERLSVQWLTPQMDGLFLEGGSAKRKFLDRLVYAFDPGHASRVAAYEQVMRERNRLLADGRGDGRWLDALEARMAEESVAIAAARLQVVERLNAAALEMKSPFPRPELSLAGTAETMFAEHTALAVEERLRTLLAEGRRQDGASGRASEGAHRTQLGVRYAELGMPAEQCSTGQQKALLLSVLIAQSRALAETSGRLPILLLDEVVAHLDSEKRAFLIEEILRLGVQAWMTGTDAHLFDGFGHSALYFNVNNASASRV